MPAAWFIKPMDLIVRRRGCAEIILTLSRLSFRDTVFRVVLRNEIPCYASENFFAKRFSSAADINNELLLYYTISDSIVSLHPRLSASFYSSSAKREK